MIDEPLRGWDLAKTEAGGGTGNWWAFKVPMENVQHTAERWRAAVAGVDKLWLCWNINSRWCLLQQKLVSEVGWTPVVGWDRNCGEGGPGALVPGAIAIDFNQDFDLPALFMHVPLEFAFLWSRKLAFWHSDVLLTRAQMANVAAVFDSLDDGEMAAVYSYAGLRNILRPRHHRYFELLGCTTQAASRNQFDNGCGWWRNIAYHVNAPTDAAEVERRKSYRNEHGVGILYWEKYYRGRVRALRERTYARNHFSVNSVKGYRKARDKSEEMDINFDLGAIARELGIADLLI